MRFQGLLINFLLASTASAYISNTRKVVKNLSQRQISADRIKRNQYNPKATKRQRNTALRPRQSSDYCPGYTNAQGQCVTKCESTDKAYKQSQKGDCECAMGYIPGTGKTCVAVCPADKLSSGYKQDMDKGNCRCDGDDDAGKCKDKCLAYQERVNGDCKDKACDDAKFTRNSSGTCVCNTAAFDSLSNGSCVEKCSSWQDRVNGSCKDKACDDAKFTRNSSGTCVCNTASFESLSNGSCVEKCSSWQDRVNGLCKDKACDKVNFSRNTAGTCICDTNAFDLVSGKCLEKCSTNFQRDTKDVCNVCPKGNTVTGSGTGAKCVATCDYKECFAGGYVCSPQGKYQDDNGNCKCPKNKVSVGNTCRDEY